jgi:hypothetical protein
MFSHSIGGAPPYQQIGSIGDGQSVGRPQRGTGYMPTEESGEWSRPYPILPCGGMIWGLEGGAVHFSPFLSKGVKSGAAAIIYGVMTWVFYAAKGATIFSIERTIDPKTPWLNVFTSTPEDFAALDAMYARLIKSQDKEAELVTLVGELRP